MKIAPTPLITGIALVITTIVCWSSCVTAPDFPDTPVLEFVSFSKSSMIQSTIGTDTVVMTLRFTDGDGDVGVPDGEPDQNIELIDRRTDFRYATFSTPEIPAEGVGNGIDVEVRILLLNDCCVYDDPSIPACTPLNEANELSFDITVKDQAGNVSNVVTSPAITLICGT